MEIVNSQSRSFTEVSLALSKALEDIKEKKEVFDKATAAVNAASKEYNSSIENAQFLRNELEKTLNDSMGSIPATRVRQSL